MTKDRTTIVAILGMIGTVVGTLGGVVATNHYAQSAALESRLANQTIAAYYTVLTEIFGDNKFIAPVLYGSPDVIKKIANLKEISKKTNEDLKDPELREAIVDTLLSMRAHVNSNAQVNEEVSSNIERIFF